MMESVQALQAISVSQQVSANNVANMNTSEFRSSRVEYETGPGDQGVRVREVTEKHRLRPAGAGQGIRRSRRGIALRGDDGRRLQHGSGHGDGAHGRK